MLPISKWFSWLNARGRLDDFLHRLKEIEPVGGADYLNRMPGMDRVSGKIIELLRERGIASSRFLVVYAYFQEGSKGDGYNLYILSKQGAFSNWLFICGSIKKQTVDICTTEIGPLLDELLRDIFGTNENNHTGTMVSGEIAVQHLFSIIGQQVDRTVINRLMNDMGISHTIPAMPEPSER